MTITSHHKASKPRVVVVTLVILLMFLSRAAFDMLQAVGIFNLSLDGGISVCSCFILCIIIGLYLCIFLCVVCC